MSSVSCFLVRNPSSFYGESNSMKNEEYNVLSAVMWALGSLLVSFNVEMNRSNTGVLVSVNIFNILLMLFSTLLLGKGLRDRNPSYVLPWVLISFWSMYQIQYLDICKLYKIVSNMGSQKFPWITFVGYAISLLVRFHLTLSVGYVALQQWYNKKLFQEIKENLKEK